MGTSLPTRLLGGIRRSTWLAYVEAFAISLVYIAQVFPTVGYFMVSSDLGIQMGMATQISLGRHPFVDIDTGVYGPLVFYGSYLGQAFSGGRPMGEIAIALIGFSASYTLLYHVLRRMLGATWLTYVPLLLLLLLVPPLYKYYIVLGPTLFVAALYRASDRVLSLGNIALLALSITIAGLYRLDYGAYGLVTAVLMIVLSDKSRRRSSRGVLILQLCGFGLLFTCPWLAFLLVRGDVGVMVTGALHWVSGTAKGVALDLPVYSLERGFFEGRNRFVLAFWIIRLLPAVVLVWLAISWRRIGSHAERVLGLCLAVFAAAVFQQAVHRIDAPHLLQILPVQLILGAWLASSVLSRWSIPVLARPVVYVGVAIPFLLAMPPKEVYRAQFFGMPMSARFGEYQMTMRELRDPATWIENTQHHLSAEVAQWIHEVTTADTGVLFLPNLSQLYYLTERGFTTRMGMVLPGHFETASDEAAFIDSMDTTRIVLDVPTLVYDGDPRRDARVFAPRLMRHIYTNYAIIRIVGKGFVLTNDDALMQRHGEFPAKFDGLDLPLTLQGSDTKFPADVAAINTMAVPDDGVVSMRRGGGLLITFSIDGASALQAAFQGRISVGLYRDGELYRTPLGRNLTRALFDNEAPGNRATGFETISGTAAVPAGTYDVLILGHPGSTPRQLKGYPTGVQLQLLDHAEID